MKYKTTKENTYNTIPKRASGSIWDRLNRKNYESLNKEDHRNPQIGCQYLEDRYATRGYTTEALNSYLFGVGEQAPSIQ